MDNLNLILLNFISHSIFWKKFSGFQALKVSFNITAHSLLKFLLEFSVLLNDQYNDNNDKFVETFCTHPRYGVV